MTGTSPGPRHRIGNALRDGRRFMVALSRLRPYIKPHVPSLLLASLASVGYAVVTLLEPWPIQFLFDGVLLGRKVHFLGHTLKSVHGDPIALLIGSVAAILVLAALRGQLYYTQNVLTATAGQDVVMSLRRELFRHLQSLSLRYHHRERLGDILMRLTGDIVMLRDMVVAALLNTLSHTLVVVGVLCVMLTINWKLTLVAAAVAPALFIILSIFRVKLMEAAALQRKREGRLVSSAHEILQAIHVVQANTAEVHEQNRFREMNQRSLNAGIRSTRIEARLHRTVQITIAAGVGATLGLGALDVLAGRLSPGQLLVFAAYVRGLYGPLRQVSKTVQRTAKASACADRVLEVLEEKPEIQSAPSAHALQDVQGAIRLDHVTFGYTPGKPVLQDVHLDIAPRTTVALVGPTGSGKTTFLNLIPRFYDPLSGEVRIDGMEVRSLDLNSLRRHISYLTQEVVVMGLTVRDNIAYGAIGKNGSDPMEEEIQSAARAAYAHEFIVKLPHGYDTVLGERGTTLSGGQRQRIAIARAFIRDARILLFDEPMTGLDPLAEQAVQRAFANLSRGRTTIVVAHHLSTILHADRILFLEAGRIVEQGSHEQLLRRSGAYAEFYRTQWALPTPEPA
ncbi:MAG: ABC transporter ATP-binding protein [Candidatus Eisenbacteria bacterium]|uniref:ABC transporter ATP-binding protein n=1 Tax=Eiseniibacteriota bacterium TaxID=2212470 RepID=A0A538TH50_UNCEI|nr:MAG: ABC transporter ATP-binding protein [Candidatus Eisenbacteria bacterium]